jgi:hypothetical protein
MLPEPIGRHACGEKGGVVSQPVGKGIAAFPAGEKGAPTKIIV